MKTEILPLYYGDKCNRADPYIEANSGFSDFSDSLNSVNSLKVLLHLGKTPLNEFNQSAGVQLHKDVTETILKGNWHFIL